MRLSRIAYGMMVRHSSTLVLIIPIDWSHVMNQLFQVRALIRPSCMSRGSGCRIHFAVAMATLLMCLGECSANAFLPSTTSDEDLAAKPVIVVARWAGAPFTRVEKPGDDSFLQLASRTEIIIERVIKGNVQPGRTSILIGPFIGWDKKNRIGSYGGTTVVGLVEAAKSNLWFLSYRQLDAADPKQSLSLDHYDCVRPLHDEPYFAGLASGQISNMLDSWDPELIWRTLSYICGDYTPSRFSPGQMSRFLTVPPEPQLPGADTDNPRFGMPRSEGRDRQDLILYDQASRVLRLTYSPDPKIRGPAAAAYALLAGSRSVARLRPLIRDPDLDVCVTAITALAYYRDSQSIPAICSTISYIHDGFAAASIIRALDGWPDLRLAPTLMGFLQMDSPQYCAYTGRWLTPDDSTFPGADAALALKHLTGYLFPYDVQVSRSAWAQAVRLADPRERVAYLARVAPNMAQPLKVKLKTNAGELELVVRNISPHPVWIERLPGTNYDLYGPQAGEMSSGDRATVPLGRASFAHILPGESITRSLDPVTKQRIAAEGLMVCTVTLGFDHNGNQFGINAWVGRVSVTVNARPKYGF